MEAPKHTPVSALRGYSDDALEDEGVRSVYDGDHALTNAIDAEWKRRAIERARLIAAAPDMYEALREVDGSLGALVDDGAINDEMGIVARLRAALARAEGR